MHNAGKGQSTAKNNLLMQLRKCCAHPALFEQNLQPLADIAALKAFTAASGKLALLDQMVRAFMYKFLVYQSSIWKYWESLGALGVAACGPECISRCAFLGVHF